MSLVSPYVCNTDWEQVHACVTQCEHSQPSPLSLPIIINININININMHAL